MGGLHRLWRLETVAGLSLKALLVRVVDTGGPYTGFLDDARFVNMLPEFKEDASTYLEDVAGGLAEQGVEAKWKVLDGSPARAIVDEPRTMPNDLIVITSHGRTGFTRWWLGSVSEALVRASGDPVLVIPSEQAD